MKKSGSVKLSRGIGPSLLLLGIVAVLLLLGMTIFGPWEIPGLGQLSQRQQGQESQAAGICPDDGDWGINTGNSNNPAGLVVKTQMEDGTAVNTSFYLSTVDTDGTSGNDLAGYSIVRNNANFNSAEFVKLKQFSTGSVFYCGNLSDTYPGYAVFGFGSTRSNGNHWTLWDKEVFDTTGHMSANDEEFKISGLSAVINGRQGRWAGSFSGWDTAFKVTAGRTTRITLTFHPTVDPNADSDKDGFTDSIEKWVTTDPFDNCADNATDAAWPPDLNNDKKVDQTDAEAFKPHMSKPVNDSNRRFDLNADKYINIVDVLSLSPYMNKSCPL